MCSYNLVINSFVIFVKVLMTYSKNIKQSTVRTKLYAQHGEHVISTVKGFSMISYSIVTVTGIV